MANLTLVIGSKAYSSWSLRPWLALKAAGIPFCEIVIPLRRPDSAAAIARHSPSGKVPTLLVDGTPIWDSLAICEYAAELAPALWPADPLARAAARAVSAEMHSGFATLRGLCPMEVMSRYPAPASLPEPLAVDIARIHAIWQDCRSRWGGAGPFLFGSFSIADAMYAPVVWRFIGYALPTDPTADAYIATMHGHPAMVEWAAAAQAEVAAGV